MYIEGTPVKPLCFHCDPILPLVYDDSLSYMEVLAKVVDKLNAVIEDVNDNLSEYMSEFVEAHLSDIWGDITWNSTDKSLTFVLKEGE